MIFLHLVLAHLFGDFVFQPTKLLKYKLSSAWGVLIHILVHLVLNLLVLLPFLLSGNTHLLWIIVAIVFTHYYIDRAKIIYEKKNAKKKKKPSIWPFLLDQLVHLTIIFVSSVLVFGTVNEPEVLNVGSLYLNQFFLFYIMGLVILIKAYDIFCYQKNKTAKSILIFNQKIQIKRVVIFSVIYLLFYLFTRG